MAENKTLIYHPLVHRDLVNMKEIIKSVLDRHKDSQVNLASEVAREKIASEIERALSSYGKYTIMSSR